MKAKFYRGHLSAAPRLLPLSAALALLGFGGPVLASVITVNTLADPGTAGDALCSVREAVGNAASDSDTTGGDCLAGSGADTIKFASSGTITLGKTLVVGDAAGQTLDGAGQSVTLSGGGTVRVLQINAGSSATIRNLTIANGFAGGSGFTAESGGGIANAGVLTIANSTFTGNRAAGFGGAIANQNPTLAATGSSLKVVNSTFTGNQATSGGAIDNAGVSVVSLTNSTIVRNTAVTPAACTGFCTQGSLASDGGGISNSGTLNLNNSIIAGNLHDALPSELSGLVVSSGSSNVIGDAATSGGFQNGVNGNIVGVDAASVLAPTLGNYGGSTATLALLSGSVALDTAGAANCPATDQRGIARPQGTGCDIGAFELVAVPAADLAITATALANPVVVQDRLTMNIAVSNRGPNTPSAVKVSVSFPTTGLTAITATASQGSCGASVGGVIDCSLGGIASGGGASVSISAIATATQTLVSTATVSSELADNQTTNNSANLAISVQPLTCYGLAPTIVGTPGADILTGTIGRDVIHGLSGNDTIRGMENNDIICGGEGADTIVGGDGNDILSGGNGNDLISGDYGDDNLNGDAGNDSLNGGISGRDACNGATGTDKAVNCESVVATP